MPTESEAIDSPPPMPLRCARESRRTFVLSLLPACAVVVLLALGQTTWAALIFGITFVVIAVGSIWPRCALFGPLVTRLPQGHHGVCLTVDDGPDPDTTPRLLDLLDQHHAQAVFFLIGDRARRHPDLVREIARRGHVIGNHSQTHPSATFWTLRPQRMWAEIAGCQQTLTTILGTTPVWFRPPVGHHNLFVAAPLRALGLSMMIWNTRGFDGVKRDVSAILRCLERDLQPGAIVLLHDATPVAAAVLEGTLHLMRERGLTTHLPLPSDFAETK